MIAPEVGVFAVVDQLTKARALISELRRLNEAGNQCAGNVGPYRPFACKVYF